MENNDAKKANRKALPKFLLLLIASAAAGGVIGHFSVRYGLDGLAEPMKAAGVVFAGRVAPWLLVALAVLVPAVAIPFYRAAKKLLAGWDGEDEDVSDAVDEKLSAAIWIVSAAIIVGYFLLAAAYSRGFAAFENDKSAYMVLLGIGGFLAVLVECILIQQKCVDAAKKTNPEKTASVYDMRFQKKWMDSCDEAEKAMVGKCAFKAFSAASSVCNALALVFTLSALIFNTGFLPVLAVCLVWLVGQCVYCREAMKCGRRGNRDIL